MVSTVWPARSPPSTTTARHAVIPALGKVAASAKSRCAGTATRASSGKVAYSASTPSMVPPSSSAFLSGVPGPEIQRGK